MRNGHGSTSASAVIQREIGEEMPLRGYDELVLVFLRTTFAGDYVGLGRLTDI